VLFSLLLHNEIGQQQHLQKGIGQSQEPVVLELLPSLKKDFGQLGAILIRATITMTFTLPSNEANREHGMWDGVPILHGCPPGLPSQAT
jgi:hypothetical protein